MKVNLMSDLHLEFCSMPPLPGGETLFLAGDIMVAAYTNASRMNKHSRILRKRFSDFLEEVDAKYQKVYIIAGNHESYHGDINKTHKMLRDFNSKYPNITYMENDCVPLNDNTMLFGATMWTNMKKSDPLVMQTVKGAMNDFNLIKNKDEIFTPECSVQEHEATLSSLGILMQGYPDKDFVIMTHHSPSYKSIHPKYGNDLVNYAFSSDLSDLILDNPRIKVWVHGHTHDTFNYSIGDCRVMCNPRGYTKNPNIIPENRFFDINFSFEVN